MGKKIIKLLNNRYFILFVWLLLAVVVALKQYHKGTFNNYLIFKYTFNHALEQVNLYAEYPNEYQDSNHYGPFFSLLIAPFAVLPNWLGILLWQIANTLFLYFAIKQLPLSSSKVNAVYWIVVHELLTAMFGLQFNASIAAVIILAYTLINREENFWAAFFIAFGTFVKLYGIVGLAFFFFVKKKPHFIAYCIFWGLVFLILPMFFFSPQYILSQYQEWYLSLSEKQGQNASLVSMQDISVMGMARRISGNAGLSNLPFLLTGIVLFTLPYLRIRQYKSEIFRMMYLSSALIFAVIFSNSSESPTYIIAFVGVAIWFMIQDRPVGPVIIALFIFALLLTSLSPSDLFPAFVRNNYIKPYSLKALPCVLIWLFLTFQMLTKNYVSSAQPLKNG
ncbi:DUF2029 domain-containing protein [Pedobacter sp. MC2016-14]|uniref:glycosyltransferase family 87 protein n=1 Tax=Pedobacter sp. MC2016-14 TaxID=2897327 RepID=UPI001E4A49DF|nr:glycosyltransferase family 87 protein [Pedobacter sp. MC2016-14]MCD0489308.1 DUF2029 domain-containing protein [Pedobacter sp. MC2016-14]